MLTGELGGLGAPASGPWAAGVVIPTSSIANLSTSPVLYDGYLCVQGATG